MASFQIPLDALTSRMNLGARFDSVRQQTIGSRFANLKPLSEFLDIKRVSKPANLAEVQSRINHNLSYFSSNYFGVFLLLSVYSLVTHFFLLCLLVFGIAGWSQRRHDLGPCRIHGQTDRECFFRGGGLGGRPRTPHDVPPWGRPPGGRGNGGRNRRRQQQEWDEWEGRRVEELDSEDESVLSRDLVPVDLRYAAADRRLRRRDRERSYSYSDETSSSSNSDEDYDDYYGDPSDPSSMQLALRDKEEMLVQQALARIRRAQEKGKQNVKLTQPQIDALQRKQKAGLLPPSKPSSKGKGSPKPTSRNTSSSNSTRAKAKSRVPLTSLTLPDFSLARRSAASTKKKSQTPPQSQLVPLQPDMPLYSTGAMQPGFMAAELSSTPPYSHRTNSRPASSSSLSKTFSASPITKSRRSSKSLRGSAPPTPPLSQNPYPAPQDYLQAQRYSSLPEGARSGRALPHEAAWTPAPRRGPPVQMPDPFAYQTYSPAPGAEVAYSSLRRNPPPVQARSDPALAGGGSGRHRRREREYSEDSSEQSESDDSEDDEDGEQGGVVVLEGSSRLRPRRTR
ncbi:MAG: hypothetical protein M1814_004764 [Vezdaea aestivalis]|nr:MAG: hypothetical protein M1814_004764 [Vezdaea aestivalis]